MSADAEPRPNSDWNDWSEADYRRTLEVERRGFAWVLCTFGKLDPDHARGEAHKRYPYEPPETPYRGLIFHDESWHWAMLYLHGEGYWRTRPDLADPSSQYRQMSFENERSQPPNE